MNETYKFTIAVNKTTMNILLTSCYSQYEVVFE